MNFQAHDALKAKIWEIANRLRGPYRPPQYRLVMLPMVVLRRLDCVLAPTKDAVLERYQSLQAQQMPEAAMDKLLGKAADPTRKHPLYNTSPYSFERLLGDSENIAPNLGAYITALPRLPISSSRPRSRRPSLPPSANATLRLRFAVTARADPSRIANSAIPQQFQICPVTALSAALLVEAGPVRAPRA
ncbi:type I restriction-modification system subunit M N-terminal domain-containing protein [Halochromatium salexigens]|uniref:type I restriction-modification system subunit M N-terminal domain-containing protein n=1 Tax=Halochromatium salexigens TaxID=49447 RepID=UPI0030B81988